jgi:hypothetical protein
MPQAGRTVYGLGTERAILADRLRKAAEPIAEDARRRSARWSRRVPLSVRLQGGASRITIAAGGPSAPQAYTMEGKPSGAPRSHPVFARGTDRSKWTWVKQPPRPFLREAIDAQADEMARIFAGIVDDWAKQAGYR